MTGRTSWAAVTATVVLGIGPAPVATAVTPPPVDDSWLPPPSPPAPPQPTEQREQCLNSGLTSAGHTTGDGGPGQLKGLELPAVWRLSRGAGQTIAVIDTGVARHRLLPHLVAGGDYVFTGDGTQDCDGHGTIVAGIIGAATDSSFDGGIAPDATVIAIRQSSNKFAAVEGASGPGFGDVDTLARAVRTAADLGATVINVSSVACVAVAAALDDRALGAALAYAVDVKNTVVVAAAGNVGAPGQCPDQNPGSDPARPGQPDWDTVRSVVSPAWYDDYVLTVGSVGPSGTPSRFSLAGPWVDVAAPGEAVVSLDPDGDGLVDALPAGGRSTPIAGTSYAAPVVSGIVALVRARSPHLTARQVMQRIEETARRPPAGWDPFVGHGVVDALAAVGGDSVAPSTTAAVPRRPVAPPDTTRPVDATSRQVAFAGATVCVGVVAATVAVTASTGRRRRDAVAGD